MMIKREELTSPESCMSRALDDERTFVLLERDLAASATIRYWADLRVKLGLNDRKDAQIIEALRCADEMDVNRCNIREALKRGDDR